jgi:transcription initiation factor IIE alpha subunit
MSASGDLMNLLHREQRHRKRSASLDAVELSPEMGKYLQDDAMDPVNIVVRRELVSERLAELHGSTAAPDSRRADLTVQEARVLALMRERERKTDIYAAALGIRDLSLEEQRRQVKRAKDRLIKRLKRSET